MILPPDDGCRNKLSRKSRAKAMARGQGKKKQKPRKQKPQPASNKSQKPEEAPKVAPRGGLPVAAAAGLDQLEQVNRNAAGIDLGADVHFVAVPPGRDPETHVRCFSTFTADLVALADWLKQCGIETVAMESTGIYWIPLYDLLEQRGFEVLLINPADFKKFRRKTDVSDCIWLQTLHTFGLLQGSFRPHEKIVTLRSYLRHRDNLVKCATDEVRRMQRRWSR
jgi:hypothetical protein